MIILPPNSIMEATPFYIDRGGIMEGALNGGDQRLTRLGDRWGASFKTKPLKANDAGLFIARLIQGRRQGARIRFPTPGMTFPEAGGATTGAIIAANLSTLIVAHTAWATKGYAEGQWFHMLIGGRNYVHQFASAPVASPGANQFSVEINPPLRIAVPASTPLVFPPVIEGFVKGDPRIPWTIDQARIYGLDFTIDEAE
jgi:hypothetical protein